LRHLNSLRFFGETVPPSKVESYPTATRSFRALPTVDCASRLSAMRARADMAQTRRDFRF
jgi:hypothetical protein